MPDPSRSELLSFLAKPRSLDDIVHRFGISSYQAKSRLQNTLRLGQTLRSLKPIQLSPNLKEKIEDKSSAYLHIALRSPHLKRLVSSTPMKARGIIFTPGSVFSSGVKIAPGKLWFIPVAQMKPNRLVNAIPKHHADQDFLSKPIPEKLAHRGGKPPSQLVMYDMFQELSKKRLSSREIGRRFGVSKQSIERLVRNGLLREEWGTAGIGIRYKLTKKGQVQTEAIREASRISAPKKQSFIRLRNRLAI